MFLRCERKNELKMKKQTPELIQDQVISALSLGKSEDPRYALYFTVLDLPPSVRRMTTTNWVEQLNRDYKRVLKIRGALPNENAVIALIANVALTKRRYDHPVHNLKSAPQFPWIGTLK
jgi:transposase-like protein